MSANYGNNIHPNNERDSSGWVARERLASYD